MKIRQLIKISSFCLMVYSCKSRSFSSQNVAEQAEIKNLDPMDISFLYPPLGTSPDSDVYLPELLHARNTEILNMGGDKNFMHPVYLNFVNKMQRWSELGGSPAIFNTAEGGNKGLFSHEIYSAIRSGITEGETSYPTPDPFKFNFRYLDLDSRRYEVDVLESWRWRLVSWRYDLCPNMLHQFAQLDEEQREELGEKPSICKPEIRIVAQPILGKNLMEEMVGRRLPDAGKSEYLANTYLPRGFAFADYALHFFMNVPDPAKVESLLFDLKKQFNTACPTTAAHLAIHPCLLKELSAFFKSDQAPFASQLLDILKSQMGELKRVASMTSNSNGTPWKFVLLDFQS
jgi:hypothetical protein